MLPLSRRITLRSRKSDFSLFLPSCFRAHSDVKQLDLFQNGQLWVGYQDSSSSQPPQAPAKIFNRVLQDDGTSKNDAAPLLNLLPTHGNDTMPPCSSNSGELYEVLDPSKPLQVRLPREGSEKLMTSPLYPKVLFAKEPKRESANGSAPQLFARGKYPFSLAQVRLSKELSSLRLHAKNGDISSFHALLDSLILHDDAEPFGQQSDPEWKHLCELHVDLYINACQLDNAITALHTYEKRGILPSQNTYQAAILALLTTRGLASRRTQAWNLFSHMRYVAHPIPNVNLYSAMIYACAYSTEAGPERALDLWREMTVEHGIVPTPEAYNAIILACARTAPGKSEFVMEAFRLARTMLISGFKPDKSTISALLEGAKRIADLSRAKWLLEIAIKTSHPGNSLLDDQICTHVFHAYAAFKPPLRRRTVPVSLYSGSPSADESKRKLVLDSPLLTESDTTLSLEFSTSTLPQTLSQLLAEADLLFRRITTERLIKSSPFSAVQWSTSSMNAYIAVHLSHARISDARSLWQSLPPRLGVTRNAASFVDALRRCARASRTERSEALAFAETVWKEWLDFAFTRKNGSFSQKMIDARAVERAWVAMIKIRTLTNNLGGAMALVREFQQRYPPQAIKEKSSPSPYHPEKERNLVSLLDKSHITEDQTPPHFCFNDIKLLHHRLASSGDVDGVGYLTYLCHAYMGALRRRRN